MPFTVPLADVLPQLSRATPGRHKLWRQLNSSVPITSGQLHQQSCRRKLGGDLQISTDQPEQGEGKGCPKGVEPTQKLSVTESMTGLWHVVQLRDGGLGGGAEADRGALGPSGSCPPAAVCRDRRCLRCPTGELQAGSSSITQLAQTLS